MHIRKSRQKVWILLAAQIRPQNGERKSWGMYHALLKSVRKPPVSLFQGLFGTEAKSGKLPLREPLGFG
jgi:hypothetical protein